MFFCGVGITAESVSADTSSTTSEEDVKTAIQKIENTLYLFTLEELNLDKGSSLDSSGQNYAPKFNAALGENYTYKITKSNWYPGEFIIYYTPTDITNLADGTKLDYVIR